MPESVRAPDVRGKSAIIAGEGVLPVEIAKRLAKRGSRPLVLTMRRDGDAFRDVADPLVYLRCPSLSRVI
ncbi:MAG: hypothetical protein LBJ22_00860, partial [Synergistaceae bacterium]|nr:hypothetical protein [Synergistaceae bacterium]